MTTKHARILARTLGVLAAVAVAAGAPLVAGAGEAHGGGGAAEARTSQVVAAVELISAAAATLRRPAMRIPQVAARVSRVVVTRPTPVVGDARLTLGGAHYGGVARTVKRTTRRRLTTSTVATLLAADASSHVPAAVMAEGRPGWWSSWLRRRFGPLLGWWLLGWPILAWHALRPGFAWFSPGTPVWLRHVLLGRPAVLLLRQCILQLGPEPERLRSDGSPPVMQTGSDEPPAW